MTVALGNEHDAAAMNIISAAPDVGLLLPCPFCGRDPALERDGWRGESMRIACANPACAVRPKTEYLLAAFADELRAAWNARPADSQIEDERASAGSS